MQKCVWVATRIIYIVSITASADFYQRCRGFIENKRSYTRVYNDAVVRQLTCIAYTARSMCSIYGVAHKFMHRCVFRTFERGAYRVYETPLHICIRHD